MANYASLRVPSSKEGGVLIRFRWEPGQVGDVRITNLVDSVIKRAAESHGERALIVLEYDSILLGISTEFRAMAHTQDTLDEGSMVISVSSNREMLYRSTRHSTSNSMASFLGWRPGPSTSHLSVRPMPRTSMSRAGLWQRRSLRLILGWEQRRIQRSHCISSIQMNDVSSETHLCSIQGF